MSAIPSTLLKIEISIVRNHFMKRYAFEYFNTHEFSMQYIYIVIIRILALINASKISLNNIVEQIKDL